MSFIPVLVYAVGTGVIGFIGWILGGVKDSVDALGIHQTGTTHDAIMMAWTACFLVWLVFAGFWVIREYNKERYQGGVM